MQSPALSVAFLVATLQLLVPLASLTMVTNSFCQPLLHNKQFLVLAVMYIVLSGSVVLVGPVHSFNIFGLCSFTQSFKFQLLVVTTIACFLLLLLLKLLRAVLDQLSQNKVEPDLRNV